MTRSSGAESRGGRRFTAYVAAGDNAVVQGQETRVRCGNPGCRRLLDESPSLPVVERQPCPACGSVARHFEVELSGTVHVTGHLSWEKIHEEVERSWPWLIGSLALTVAGSLIGLVLGGFPGLLVGLVLGLLSFPAGLRAATRIREIERGGDG